MVEGTTNSKSVSQTDSTSRGTTGPQKRRLALRSLVPLQERTLPPFSKMSDVRQAKQGLLVLPSSLVVLAMAAHVCQMRTVLALAARSSNTNLQ